MNLLLVLAMIGLLAQESDWIDELLFGVAGGRVTSEPVNVEARRRLAEFRARADAFRPHVSAPPEAEARFAEQTLEKGTSASLREYLPRLAAHRWICVAELADNGQQAKEARAHAAQRLA